VIVSTDIEVWLLFAPFWILGIAALIGGVLHMVHAWRVTHHQRRHHLKRGYLWLGAFVALMLLGIGVGAAAGLVLGR
jgi:uncharacterized membrane protein HdeD (DUF308 family)